MRECFLCVCFCGGVIYTSTHPTPQVSYEETRSSSPVEATAAKMSEESQDPEGEPSAEAARLEEERDKHVGGKEVCRPEAQLRFILLNSSFELVAIQGYPSTLMKIKLSRFSP